MREVVFIPELSSTTGFGHVARLTALDQMLEDQFECKFLIPDGVEVPFPINAVLYSGEISPALLSGYESSILVFDGYGFDDELLKSFSSAGFNVVKINDFEQKWDGLGLVINHTPGLQAIRANEAYGQDYALLRQTFLNRASEAAPQIQHPIQTLLLTFGGADPYNLADKAIDKCLQLGDFEITVLGSGSKQGIQYMSGLNDQQVLEQIELADAVVCPASNFFLEVCCVGKPALVGRFVDNQDGLYSAIERLDLAIQAGDWTSGQIGIERLLNEDLSSHVANQKALIDGQQAERIKERFHGLRP